MVAAVSPTHGTVACFFISACRSQLEATSSIVMMSANRIGKIIIQNPGTALLKSIAILHRPLVRAMRALHWFGGQHRTLEGDNLTQMRIDSAHVGYFGTSQVFAGEL